METLQDCAIVRLDSLEHLLPEIWVYIQSPKRYVSGFWLYDSKAWAFQTVFKLMAATFGNEPNYTLGSFQTEILTAHQEDRMHARFWSSCSVSEELVLFLLKSYQKFSTPTTSQAPVTLVSTWRTLTVWSQGLLIRFQLIKPPVMRGFTRFNEILWEVKDDPQE